MLYIREVICPRCLRIARTSGLAPNPGQCCATEEKTFVRSYWLSDWDALTEDDRQRIRAAVAAEVPT